MTAPVFLHSYVIDSRGAGRSTDANGVNAWSPEQGMLWVHIDIGDTASRRWLLEQSGVDDAIADGLLADDVRPRSLVTENGLFVVLRGVNTNPGQDPEDMVAIRVWVEANRVISVRRRQLLSVQDIRRSLDDGKGPKNPSEFLGQLMERLADRIGEFVDAMEADLAASEDEFEKNPGQGIRQRLNQLRRQVAAVRRFLAPQRDALDRLYRQAGSILTRDESEHLREEADRMTRYLEDLDLARERAIVLQEELLSLLAQEQNSRMYLLSVVAAIFLPLTFITGLFGMNVGGLPWLDSASGFATTLVIMGIAAGALVVFFRWMRWL